MTKFQALRPMLEVKDLAEYGMRDMGLRDPNGGGAAVSLIRCAAGI